MTAHLIITVGIPGSGKSTLVADAHLPVVSSDAIRGELLGDEACQDRSNEIWAEVHRRITDHLNAGRSVILDSTNVDPAHRAPLLEIARAAGAVPVAWRLTTWHRASRRSNRRRARVVPEPVMTHMARLFNERCTPEALTAEGWTVRNVTRPTAPLEV